MTTTRARTGPRSPAWVLGWSSLSGPLLEVVGNAPSRFGVPLLPWVSILLDLWAVVSVLLGVAAVTIARRDLSLTRGDRPRSTSTGLALGLVGLASSAGLLLLWLVTPLSF